MIKNKNSNACGSHLDNKGEYVPVYPVALFIPDSLWVRPHGLQPSRLFCHGIFQYWSVLPCPPPGDLPDPRVEPVSAKFPAGRWVIYH